jgi:thiopeptide-type bacteriocin biosynthesis protein
MFSPQERHEEVLRTFVTPLVGAVRDAPELDSLFFARYNVPDWQLRFRVLGRPDWVDGPVRDMVATRLRPLRESGLVGEVEFAEYQREYERYGGEEGMALCESIFLHDTLACLDLIDVESKGGLGKSRREYSIVMTERFLDLMRFDRAHRLAFYRFGYQWVVDGGYWKPDDFVVLEKRYQELKPGLVALLDREGDRDEAWGGSEAARIANACLEATRPVVDELLVAHAAGRIPVELPYLAWSLTHMHSNRLGIDATPEAILRYFLTRLYEDGQVETTPDPIGSTGTS